MKVNIKKNINISPSLEKPEFFKQFNIYKTIMCNEAIYNKEYFVNRNSFITHRLKIRKAEVTIPCLKVKAVKLIDTIEGISLEKQNLSGKKLIVIGEVSFNLVLSYCCGHNVKYRIEKIRLPFSTFIVIPKDIGALNSINLRYQIEDVSAVYLARNKLLISATPLLQYLDEYIDDKR